MARGSDRYLLDIEEISRVVACILDVVEDVCADMSREEPVGLGDERRLLETAAAKCQTSRKPLAEVGWCRLRTFSPLQNEVFPTPFSITSPLLLFQPFPTSKRARTAPPCCGERAGYIAFG